MPLCPPVGWRNGVRLFALSHHAYVNNLTRDSRGCDHCGTHQKRAPRGAALTPFEIAITRRRAHLAPLAICRGSSPDTSNTPHRAIQSPHLQKCGVIPQDSAVLRTDLDPGTTSALTPSATLCPSTTLAASLRSEMRLLVHDPTNATSIGMPDMAVPRF